MVSIAPISESPDPAVLKIFEIMERQGIDPSKYKEFRALSRITMLKGSMMAMEKVNRGVHQCLSTRALRAKIGNIPESSAEEWLKELAVIEFSLPDEMKGELGNSQDKNEFNNRGDILDYISNRVEAIESLLNRHLYEGEESQDALAHPDKQSNGEYHDAHNLRWVLLICFAAIGCIVLYKWVMMK